MTTEWPFAERYKEYMMPPTQVREALKRLAKKNVDPATDTEENLHVIKAVHQAYANKKARARVASSMSRASKRVDDCGDTALAQDAAVNAGTAAQAHVGVCDAAVDCVAEVVSEPTQATPEAVAAPTPAVAAKKKSVARADNVASASAPAPVAAVPAVVPTPAGHKQARAVEAAPRRGLCGMVASATI